jgi:NADH-quinone oxidoreductase subunit E
MIWHFLEVWLMVVLTFVLGCLAGAHLYGILATSRLATAQGIVADGIGDGLDRIKARLGLAPTWRPAHLRGVERPLPVSAPQQGVPAAPEREDARPAARRAPSTVGVVARSMIASAAIGLRRRRTVTRSDARVAQQPALPLPLPVPRQPEIVAMRPAGLSAPRGGVPDNLQRIKGIGQRNEHMLNELGIFHFGQIAAWTPAEVAWIGQALAFPDRIARDDWVGQATLLAMGSETGFQKSAERRRERRRQQREFQARMASASAAYDSAESAQPDDDGEDDATSADNGSASGGADDLPEPDSEPAATPELPDDDSMGPER